MGALELVLDRSNYESPAVQAFCRAGFCADQFSLDRVFEIGQKATLGDPSGELKDFERAVRLSPASAYRWADLADAEFNVRDFKLAEYAAQQALKAGPRSPVILMRTANLYFGIGDPAEVVRCLRAVLSDPGLYDYYDPAFLTYSRLGLPIDQILSSGVPQTKMVLSALLTFWTKIHHVEEAVATWKWADQRKLADATSTGDFFQFLMAAERQDLAQQLWQQDAGKAEPGYRKSNFVYNASFETTPVPSPFDWTIIERQDVEAVRSQDFALDGRWSFRIRFNGQENTTYHQTYQDMVLMPGRYTISVMMKSEMITTDEGVRIHVFDQPTQAKLNIWTDTVLGTKDWTRIEKGFEVPAGIRVVRVEIGRLGSAMFDNKIGGTTWVDSLKLSRQ
jgi:tetratricopeptide (TPR) repeat protein